MKLLIADDDGNVIHDLGDPRQILDAGDLDPTVRNALGTVDNSGAVAFLRAWSPRWAWFVDVDKLDMTNGSVPASDSFGACPLAQLFGSNDEAFRVAVKLGFADPSEPVYEWERRLGIQPPRNSTTKLDSPTFKAQWVRTIIDNRV